MDALLNYWHMYLTSPFYAQLGLIILWSMCCAFALYGAAIHFSRWVRYRRYLRSGKIGGERIAPIELIELRVWAFDALAHYILKMMLFSLAATRVAYNATALGSVSFSDGSIFWSYVTVAWFFGMILWLTYWTQHVVAVRRQRQETPPVSLVP